MFPSKIASLPRAIREELNLRLDDAQAPDKILAWLNGLPETQQLLAAHFDNKPITRQNLHKWKLGGFRTWQIRRTALEFAADDPADPASNPALAASITQKLTQWVGLRFAAAAHSLTPPDNNPETEIRQLNELCASIVALRRGDLHAERVSLEQKRLDLLQSRDDHEREKLFWEWTNRPDIKAKLFPQRDREQVRLEVERMLNFKLLGIPYPTNQPDEYADPAALI